MGAHDSEATQNPADLGAYHIGCPTRPKCRGPPTGASCRQLLWTLPAPDARSLTKSSSELGFLLIMLPMLVTAHYYRFASFGHICLTSHMHVGPVSLAKGCVHYTLTCATNGSRFVICFVLDPSDRVVRTRVIPQNLASLCKSFTTPLETTRFGCARAPRQGSK